METEALLSRIQVDPAICHGKPCIKGHRIMVSVILGRMAAGETEAALLADYPGLAHDDIAACLAYGARLSQGSLVALSGHGA
jgi:uncharacterized protein (DUF433 family)